MNTCKMMAIAELIRGQGGLPTDQMGEILSPEDVLVWFGLDKLLTAEEQAEAKRELGAMAEAQALVERLRMGVA